MAQGMKRLGTPIVALLALALLGMIASSWLINRDNLRSAVEAQIREGAHTPDLVPLLGGPAATTEQVGEELYKRF